ncbi:discoidin domain-containing protein [Hyalangium versicolor]|uniref:discoidin domain-containing protein n=1 Tax=Hyalangium versicolor TaxID=2861190 RepID=UPI001CCADDCE|nr:discoidin domain-containing protein [Hyalangium versicolor]
MRMDPKCLHPAWISTMLVCVTLTLTTQARAEGVAPVEDVTGILRNPAMGWVLYLEDSSPGWPDPTLYWNQQDPNRDKASILYIRVPWSRMEPTEGNYVWNSNENYKRFIQMTRDRGLKLAFRIIVDSQDSQSQATPQFVFDAGATGYPSESNAAFKTPYVTDPIFQTKFSNFVKAFALQYDNPTMVDYIDAEGLGWWGEMHHLDYLTSSQKQEVFEWVTNLYASRFKKVILGGQYGPGSFSYEVQDRALNEKGYVIRRDSYGSPLYLPLADKIKINSRFPSVPVFAENCYQGLGDWAASCDGMTSPWSSLMQRVIHDALETHANTLDLRTPWDASYWVNQFPQLVQDFIVQGGYRFVLTQASFPGNIVSGNDYTVSHTWKNTGVGKLPNDLPNWSYKYKVAFALLDKTTGQPVYTFVDPAEPADWIKGQLYPYSTTLSFVGAPAGTYDFAVAIVNRDNAARPEIKLAITNPTSPDGWYKLGTTVVSGTSAGAAVQTGAAAFTTEATGNGVIQVIADGNDTSIWASTAQVSLPQVVELHWGGRTVSTNGISLSTSYGQGQGITQVDVEYFDGRRWKPILKDRSISWATNSSTIETQDLPLGVYVSTTSLRLKIHGANRTWGNYALSEFKVWGRLSASVATVRNIAPNAVASTSSGTFPEFGSVQALVDDVDGTTWASQDGVTFPQFITLDLGQQTFRTQKLTLATHYGMGQGITLLDVEYWNSGRWNTAASSVALTWNSNTATVEQRDIPLPDIAGSKLRIKVRQANLAWGHFSANDIRVWGFGSSSGQSQVAKQAIASTTFPSDYPIYYVNDEASWTPWASTASASFPGYLVLDFGSRQVTTGKITLMTHYGQGQGPTHVDVEYYVNGSGWTNACSASLTWNSNTAALESRDIEFNGITTSQLRLKVNDSNRQWGNTTIDEWKVSGWVQ